MALPPRLKDSPFRQMGLSARSATQQIPDSSVNLAALPVKHYTNATIVKSLLIFLNAIKMASPFSG